MTTSSAPRRSSTRLATRVGAFGAALLVAMLAMIGAAGVANAAPAASTCRSLENCYTHDDMQLFYDQVIGMITQFSARTYSQMPPPQNFVYVPGGVASTSACGPVDDQAYQLCKLDDTIYVGQEALWHYYWVDGDAAAAFAIAHEWGHHVQLNAGVFDVVATQQDQIDTENQADCVGGAFLGALRDGNQLESDDIDDVNAILPEIASAEGPDRDHGTLPERNDSAQYGFDHGMAACGDFFPQAPLVTS